MASGMAPGSSTSSAATAGAGPDAEAVKRLGNEAFAKAQYQDAIRHYTAAIALDPNSSILYSNRSASYLLSGNSLRALDDAERAVRLTPTWFKALRRKAAALENRARWEEAEAVYNAAIAEARKDQSITAAARSHAESELRRLLDRLRKNVAAASLPWVPTQSPLARRSMQTAANYAVFGRAEDWPELGSVVRSIVHAERAFQEGIATIHQMTPPDRTGKVIGPSGGITQITNAAIDDARVVGFMPETVEKIQLAIQLEGRVRNAVGKMPVEQVIRHYAERLAVGAPADNPANRGILYGRNAVKGWDDVRPALALSIRIPLLGGLLKKLMGDMKDALVDLRYAVALADAARERWSYVDPAERGRTLEDTFVRQMRAILGESLAHYYAHPVTRPRKHADRKAMLEEIRKHAEWIILSTDEAKKERRSSRTEKDWDLYYMHTAVPRARAYSLLGFFHAHHANTIEVKELTPRPASVKEPLQVADPYHAAMAVLNYVRAAAWSPFDDTRREANLWNAISAMCMRGGYLFSDLLVLRSLARRCSAYYLPVFDAAEVKGEEGMLVSADAVAEQLPAAVASGAETCAAIEAAPLLELDAKPSGDAPAQVDRLARAWRDDLLRKPAAVPPPLPAKIEARRAKPDPRGCGCIAAVRELRRAWAERVEEFGEPPQPSRAEEMWEAVEPALVRDWEADFGGEDGATRRPDRYFFVEDTGETGVDALD